ncbi:hypothetical protein AHF37_01240 [Paragonimus kellicotti]|nr:hypothetical protein AHF37_01240 [Paragonimus kellicotti]
MTTAGIVVEAPPALEACIVPTPATSLQVQLDQHVKLTSLGIRSSSPNDTTDSLVHHQTGFTSLNSATHSSNSMGLLKEKDRTDSSESFSQPSERATTQTAHLNYIPPGLSCELGSPNDPSLLTVCAAGWFTVGHVWGPYLVHLSHECRQRLKTLEEYTPKPNLNITVKSATSPVDGSTIVLGEEHTWIKLLYECGLRSPQTDPNVDLLIDPSTKTITLTVTKDIAPNDLLHGALRIRSASTKTITLTVTKDIAPNDLLHGALRIRSATAKAVLTMNGLPQLGNSTAVSSVKIPPCCSTSNPGPSSPSTPTAHRVIPAKRPTSRPTSGYTNSPTASMPALLPVYPFQLLSVPSSDRPSQSVSSTATSPDGAFLPLQLTDPTLATILLNTLGPVLNLDGTNNGLHSHLAAAILPYLVKLNAPSSVNRIQSGPVAESQLSEVAPIPESTLSPPNLTRSSRTVQSPHETSDHIPKNSISSKDLSSISLSNDLTSSEQLPIHCAGCQQFFATHYLHNYHLRMSVRLLRGPDDTNQLNGNDTHNLVHQSASFRQTDDPAHCPLVHLSEAAGRYGLVLAASLITDSGLQYVPVNPACGMLYRRQLLDSRNSSPSLPDGLIETGKAHPSQGDCSFTSVRNGPITFTNALDLTCTPNPLIAGSRIRPDRNEIEPTEDSSLVGNLRIPDDHYDVIQNNSESPTTCSRFNDDITTMNIMNSAPNSLHPSLIQLVAQLVAGLNEHHHGQAPHPIVPSMAIQSGSNVDPNTSISPTILAQFMSQIYWHSATLNKQPAQSLPVAFNAPPPTATTIVNELISSISTSMQNQKCSVPCSTQQHPSPGTTGQKDTPTVDRLSEMVPALSLLNSLYQTTGLLNDPDTNLLQRATISLHQTPLPPGPDYATSPIQSPPQLTSVNRPYLCTFCRTRFQAFTTFQAHQQYYCQARRDVVRTSSNSVGSSSKTGSVSAASTGTTTTIGRSISPNGQIPNKRRRVLQPSPVIANDQPQMRQTSAQSNESSNASSPSGSGDEGEAGKLGMSPSKTEVASITNSQKEQKAVSTVYNDTENAPSITWEESCGAPELRCSVCGYVGQTHRGMKMHKKLHECDDDALRESRTSRKRRDKSTTSDEQCDNTIHRRTTGSSPSDNPGDRSQKREHSIRSLEETIKSEAT